MQFQRWQDRQITYGRLVRLLFISTAVILLLIAGIIWLLNLGGPSWSTRLTIIFVVLGVLFAFLQWVAPRSFATTQTIVALPGQMITPLTDDQAYAKFIEDERKKLLDNPDAEERGELVVRTNKSMLGQEVIIGGQRTMVSQHNILGRTIYVAFLPWLKYNNYKVEMNGRKSKWVTVHPRQVSELNWQEADAMS